MSGPKEENKKKRKLQDVEEIEIDVNAPEPPSKKALRKAKKKQKLAEQQTDTSAEPQTKPSETQTEPAKKKKKKQRSEYGIWIGNLPFSVTKADLRKFLTDNCSFGDSTITRVHLPTGPAKNGKPQNKGFAYIDLADSKAVEEAIGLSEQLLSGRPVLIKDAKNFEGRPEKPQEGGEASKTSAGKPPSRRIFVGNLAFDATKELLEEHFSKCGTVKNVHVATFEDSGKCKGYAWVEFEDQEAAEAAVKGFAMVKEEEEEEPEEDSEDESAGSDYEDNGPTKAKTPKLKKVWVNRFLGRQLRMEFAEDSATRYKKRFGKKGKGKNKSSEEEAVVETEQSEVNGAVDKGTGAERAHAKKEKRSKKAKKETESHSRYSKETVQRLTGAIVESQGKKTTFD